MTKTITAHFGYLFQIILSVVSTTKTITVPYGYLFRLL